MLFVVTLTIMFLVVAAGGAKKSWESQQVRASAYHLAHDIALASQTAQKLNKTVVIRFYKYDAPEVAGQATGCVHAYQLLVYDPPPPGAKPTKTATEKKPDYRPLYEVQKLDGTTLISENANRFTTIFAVLDGRGSPDQDIGIGNYKFAALEFRPDGSTNLPTPPPEHLGPMTITLIPARTADTPEVLAKECTTLVIHPENSTVAIY